MLAAAAALSWAQAPRGPSPPSVSREGVETSSGVSEPRPSQRALTIGFRGRELPYVVIDGMAVHAGDMVLGRVEDLVLRPPLQESRKPVDPAVPKRRDLSPNLQKPLWPEGAVSYVIDSDVSLEQRENIEVAIRDWNEKTVLSLVARTTESNYVRFSNVVSGYCRSKVGMVGGEQEISLPPDGCPIDAVVHEIGHAVGLWHEHQREDRDDYVTVLYENLDPSRHYSYPAKHPALGPYDYASVMHYDPQGDAWNGRDVFETIPPGMSIPSAGLSAGDIDGVARLYGKPLEATSITTNPPGLEIVVDGVRVTAPASFEWADGSAHIIEAPVSQTIEGSRYLFGRWNDGGSRLRNVAAGAGSTWLEANFIVQHRVGTRAEPADAGTVDLLPPSPDGYYTLRTPIQAVPTPDPTADRTFLQWDGTIWGQHGRSSNPATWSVDRPGKEFAAVFTERPVFRITANVDPFVLHIRNYYDNVDEDWTYAPANLLTDVARTTIGLGIDEVLRAPHNPLRRYRLRGLEQWRREISDSLAASERRLDQCQDHFGAPSFHRCRECGLRHDHSAPSIKRRVLPRGRIRASRSRAESRLGIRAMARRHRKPGTGCDGWDDPPAACRGGLHADPPGSDRRACFRGAAFHELQILRPRRGIGVSHRASHRR